MNVQQTQGTKEPNANEQAVYRLHCQRTTTTTATTTEVASRQEIPVTIVCIKFTLKTNRNEQQQQKQPQQNWTHRFRSFFAVSVPVTRCDRSNKKQKWTQQHINSDKCSMLHLLILHNGRTFNETQVLVVRWPITVHNNMKS